MFRTQLDRVSVATAARLLAVPPEKVRRLLRAGELEGRKIGGSWEVQRQQLTKQMVLPFEKYRAGGRDGRKES